MQRRTPVAVVATLLVLSAAYALGDLPADEDLPRGTGRAVAAAQKIAPIPAPLKARCSIGSGAFVPTGISVPRVSALSPVWGVAREPNGVPGTPPISEAGKHVFGWDEPGVKPGSPAGTAVLDAHTWPDGTAMGNALLAFLKVGDVLRLHGADGRRQCYRVHREDYIHVTDPDPPGFYSTTGEPMITIIVCSGTRLGPGNWDHRTIWFARPI